MTTRSLASLLGIALLALLLTACGSSEPAPASSSAPSPTEPTAMSPAPTTGTAPAASEAPASSAVSDALDSALAPYEKSTGVSGTLTAVGSDTMNNLATLWAESFQRLYPAVRIQVEGKGSSTVPPALIQGTAQIGPMSRAMSRSEIDAFEKAFGYEPTEIRIAIDALAVYVHQDNPIESLTIPQIDAIFSSTRKCGAPLPLRSWGDLGVAGPWAARPISTYGRNSASGTYGFFKKVALCGGDFLDTVKQQPGSASVVSSISGDAAGIGYSGIGYRTSGVKTLSLARAEGEPAYTTAPDDVKSGRYPLARHLYVYVNRAPGKPLDPIVREFLLFVLSKDGQGTVLKDGYLPLSAAAVAEERAKVL